MLSNSRKIFLYKIYRKLIVRFPLSGRPSIFIVGTQKAGTTSLHEYLCHHPEIKGGLLKELHFFNKDRNFARGYKFYERNFKNFQVFNNNIKFLDSTPEYMTNDLYLARLQEYNSSSRIIVLLREPVARAYSAWNFYRRLPQFSKQIYDFTQLVKDEIKALNTQSPFSLDHLGIVRYGCYSNQVIDLFNRFPKEQILILGSDQLSKKPGETLRKIFHHVGVSDQDPSRWIKRKRNAGTYKPIPNEAKILLSEYYEPFNQQLVETLGYKPEW